MRSEWNRMLAAGPCKVVFIKADGTQRTMICSREQSAVEEAGEPGSNGSNPNVVTVVDLAINEWRCFKPERVISFEQQEALVG